MGAGVKGAAMKLSSGEKLAWRQIVHAGVSKNEPKEKRLMALLLLQFPRLDQRSFEKRTRAIYESDSVQGPRAVAWGMRMMATQCEPGEGRSFFLEQMELCKEDAARMKKVRQGWRAFGEEDPWWVVHSIPERPLPRYNSEPSFR